jgi:SpoVK/Ycf46/Vps4 family AAA+-type ATPase
MNTSIEKKIQLIRCESTDRYAALSRLEYGEYPVWTASDSVEGSQLEQILCPVNKASAGGQYVWVNYLSALQSLSNWDRQKVFSRLMDLFFNSDAEVVIVQTDICEIPYEIHQIIDEYVCPFPNEHEAIDQIKAVGLEADEQTIRLSMGLSHSDLKRCLQLAVAEPDPKKAIEEYRSRKLSSIGLKFLPPPARREIGGLDLLQAALPMLEYRLSAEAEEWGLPSPNGWILAGVPGTGKTYSAKAIAAKLGLPMFILGIDAVQKGGAPLLERMLKTAEACAPCVLFLDEMEKLIGDAEGAIRGVFLSWLNDKTSKVFVIGAINEIDKLAQETLRAGRFDKVWQVDSPDEQSRIVVAKLFLKALDDRFIGVEPVFSNDEWQEFADSTNEFIGAEIEQLVYDTFTVVKMRDAKAVIDITDLLDAARNFKTAFKRNTAGFLRIRNKLDKIADRTNSGNYGVLLERQVDPYD